MEQQGIVGDSGSSDHRGVANNARTEVKEPPPVRETIGKAHLARIVAVIALFIFIATVTYIMLVLR